MGTGKRIDQLRSYANARPTLPNRTLQNVTNAEFTPHLLNLDGVALVGESGITSDYE